MAKQKKEKAELAIVGIGASAGGLEALCAFFDALAADSAMAFVVVQHLDPKRESHMVKLLATHTQAAVFQAEDGQSVKPNHVYVLPPNRIMTIEKGLLQLSEQTEPHGQVRPIDMFFRSLAEDQGERAIGIILSGAGTDGAAGLIAVKDNGGMTMSQDPTTAKHDGMPRAAIGSGAVDFILPPEKMPHALLNYASHPYIEKNERAEIVRDGDQFNQILALLRARSGHDFRSYRKPTLARRIHRRMGLNSIEGVSEYTGFLRDHPQEAQALARDMMITVTGFFREPEAWKVLEQVTAPLIRAREVDAPMRVWVPGCSTGEEAYSIVMVLIEQAEAAHKELDIKIFATDVAEDLLNSARHGTFTESVAADVSPERLRRFFHEHDHTYQVQPQIRELVTFAPHNLLKDPPFSRIDLVSCRNLMIYLEPEAQKKVIALLHYGLVDGGYLFLGSAESVGERDDLFQTVSKKWRIYRRTGPTQHDLGGFSLVAPPEEQLGLERSAAREPAGIKPAELARQILSERYAPASVLTDRKHRVLYFHGPTEEYLVHPAGEPTHDLPALAREGLRARLQMSLRRAASENRTVTARATLKGGKMRRVRLTVTPVRSPHWGEDLLLVSFEKAETPLPAGDRPESGEEAAAERQFEEELTKTRSELQAVIEELESSNEELRASNEEVTSMNEELQSTNEELQASREELQALNEELSTVNSELEHRIEEVEEKSNDLSNLLASTDIATIFLDLQLRIRWFSPAVKQVMEIISTDVGRPIGHLAQTLTNGDLLHEARSVLENLTPVQTELRSPEGRWYLRRILPYRTQDNRIEGLVVTFSEITAQKEAQEAIDEARIYAEGIVKTVREPLLVLDSNLCVHSASPSFYDFFEVTPRETEGRLLYEFGNRQWDIPELRKLLEQILPQAAQFNDFEVEHDSQKLGRRSMLLNARTLYREGDRPRLILLAFEDVTERKRAAQLFEADRRKDEFLATLSHELRTPLTSILGWASQLQSKKYDAEALGRALEIIERNARLQVQIVDDLLDVSRIITGKLPLNVQPLELTSVIEAAIESLKSAAKAKSLEMTSRLDTGINPYPGDPGRLQQVISNLLSNAIKFTPEGGKIEIRAERRDSEVLIAVQDSGIGIDREFLPHVFEPFRQGDSATKRKYGGLGLGLSLVRRLVELHAGVVEAYSAGKGQGSTFTVRLPLPGAKMPLAEQ